MSIFGKIFAGLGKDVGKLALSEAGSLTGTSSFVNGSTFDKKPSATSQGHVANAGINSPTGGVNVSTGFDWSSLGTFFTGVGQAGHAVANGTATVNGRVSIGDAAGNSGLPSWLLPVGAGVGILVLLTSMGGKRR